MSNNIDLGYLVMSWPHAVARLDFWVFYGKFLKTRKKEEKRLEMVERYNEKLKEYEFIREQISFIENTLNKMPEELKTMLNEVYIQGMTFSYVGKLHGYSDHGLWKLMKRETEKYL